MIRHLGVQDWIIREIHDELDFVGPVAQRLLRAHGVLWPANLHFLAPVAAEGAGGAAVSGVGGDRTLSSGPDEIAPARPGPRGPASRGARRVSPPSRPRPGPPYRARVVRADAPGRAQRRSTPSCEDSSRSPLSRVHSTPAWTMPTANAFTR